jgi:outer membrane beta-barrel protein
MAGRIGIFLLRHALPAALAGLLFAVGAARADDVIGHDGESVIEPELERRTITEADIDSEDFEAGAYAGVLSIEDFGTNFVYGVRAAYHITEDFFAEAAYGRSEADETSYETLSGGAKLLTDSQRRFDYYNISLGYNLFPGEAFIGGRHAFNTALYVISGVGNTEFADDSHFTVNVGAGYRFLLTDWMALHVDVRDYIFKSDLLGNDKTTNNLEFTGGLTFFF